MFSVTSPDGIAIACHQGGEGPSLVLVHGTTASHSRWNTIRPRFEAHFTVTAIDRRGRGDSGDAPDYAIEREFDDLVAVVESLQPPTLVFGHSYGALCVLEAALRTDRLSGLVLYEPPIVAEGESFYAPGQLDRLDALLAAGDREALLDEMFVEIVRVTPRELGLLKASPTWQDRLAAAHTIPRECRAEGVYRLDPVRLRALAVPALLLLGGDSAPVFAKGIATLQAGLPDARTVAMPGQKHVAMETGPDLVVNAVLDFWREVSPRR